MPWAVWAARQRCSAEIRLAFAAVRFESKAPRLVAASDWDGVVCPLAPEAVGSATLMICFCVA